MTKPRSNRLGMYDDVRQILNATLGAGGGSYECGTHGQAIHWRQRAYRFRKLYAETLGLTKESPYDKIVIPRVPLDSSTCILQLRKQVGTFTPSGESTPFFDDDPLLEEAEAIAKRLGV